MTVRRAVRLRALSAVSLLLACCAGLASAQPNTELVAPLAKPDDSGWIKLFNGVDLKDWFGIDQALKPFDVPNAVFAVKNGAIWASGTAPRHILHKQNFTYYHFRMRYRHVSTLGNAGMLYHVRLDGGSCCGGQFPRSIEAQGNSSGMGECWTIGGVVVKTRIAEPYPETGRKYSETGKLVDHGDDNGRKCAGSSNPYKGPAGTWNNLEVKIWGSDSSHHIANGLTVFRASDIRFDGTKKLNYGFLAFQSEGKEMEYADLEIKLLPQDPLYSKVYGGTGIRAGGSMLAPMGTKAALRIQNDLSGGLVLIHYRLPGSAGSRPALRLSAGDGRTLAAFHPETGAGTWAWRPAGAASGRYFATLSAKEFRETRSIVLLP